MTSLLEIAWLIPLLPFIGSLFILALLICFNRTMNRLTKPVSFFLIFCVALPTALSFALFQKQIVGQILNLDLNLANIKLHLDLYADKISTISSVVFGLVSLLLMTFSYFSMERKQGYVRYFVLFGLSCGLIFSFILSANPFQNLF